MPLSRAISGFFAGYWYRRCFLALASETRPHFGCARFLGRRTLGDCMNILSRHAARTRQAVALFALATLSACHRNRSASEIEAASNEPTTIEFRNESLAQADVFVSSASMGARRLGTVFAGRTETLTVPKDIAIRGTINVAARLLARSAIPSSGSIAISPGAHLSVRLPLDERALYVLPAN